MTLLKGLDDVVVSVSIDIPSYSQRDAPFQCIAYYYYYSYFFSCVDKSFLLNNNFLCVCVCVCVFMSIHHEGFVCLNQLGYQGMDQQCYVKDINFLCQIPSSLL